MPLTPSPRLATPAGLVILDVSLIRLLVCFEHVGPIVLRTAAKKLARHARSVPESEKPPEWIELDHILLRMMVAINTLYSENE